MFTKHGGVREPRCPVCRTKLRCWGDEDNYINKASTEHWICDKCGYDRDTYKKWKVG